MYSRTLLGKRLPPAHTASYPQDVRRDGGVRDPCGLRDGSVRKGQDTRRMPGDLLSGTGHRAPGAGCRRGGVGWPLAATAGRDINITGTDMVYLAQQQRGDGGYLDWNDSIRILTSSYEAGLFVLIIGSKGTGKTSLVRSFADMAGLEMESINFSLRTRESHLVGTKTLTDGTVGFDEGILIKSMREGDLLYLDEINSAEADVLLRLDEALDSRRQIALKESRGQVVRAKDGWFVVATINPLTHSGTKELPPQLLSRFPVRIRLEYPSEEIELQIVKRHLSGGRQGGEPQQQQQEPLPHPHEPELIRAIRLANTLRRAAAVEELFYSPSLRETIAFGKLVEGGMAPREAADHVFGNVYTQWGDIEYQKVSDIIVSMFGGGGGAGGSAGGSASDGASGGRG